MPVDDVDALVDAIGTLLGDAAAHDALVARSEHVQAFSWERCADATIAVYREALPASTQPAAVVPRGADAAGETAYRVRTSTPVSVTRTVCSNCAVREPSAVTAVQPSSQMTGRMSPIVIMGSMVKTIPGSMIVRSVRS